MASIWFSLGALASWRLGVFLLLMSLVMTTPSVRGGPPVGSPALSSLAPLRHPLFRALWIASTVSHVGSYMTDVGQGWLMTTLSPSPLLVALLVTAESLPFFALGL